MTWLRRLRVRWWEAVRRQAISELQAEARRGEASARRLKELRAATPPVPNPYALCACLHRRQHHGDGACRVRPCGCEGFLPARRW